MADAEPLARQEELSSRLFELSHHEDQDAQDNEESIKENLNATDKDVTVSLSEENKNIIKQNTSFVNTTTDKKVSSNQIFLLKEKDYIFIKRYLMKWK